MDVCGVYYLRVDHRGDRGHLRALEQVQAQLDHVVNAREAGDKPLHANLRVPNKVLCKVQPI